MGAGDGREAGHTRKLLLHTQQQQGLKPRNMLLLQQSGWIGLDVYVENWTGRQPGKWGSMPLLHNALLASS